MPFHGLQDTFNRDKSADGGIYIDVPITEFGRKPAPETDSESSNSGSKCLKNSPIFAIF